MTAAALASGPASRRPEKENMTDFLAKKREIFLVQMSLDTKRAEITKLEERALQASCAISHLILGLVLGGSIEQHCQGGQTGTADGIIMFSLTRAGGVGSALKHC